MSHLINMHLILSDLFLLFYLCAAEEVFQEQHIPSWKFYWWIFYRNDLLTFWILFSSYIRILRMNSWHWKNSHVNNHPLCDIVYTCTWFDGSFQSWVPDGIVMKLKQNYHVEMSCLTPIYDLYWCEDQTVTRNVCVLNVSGRE